MLQPCDLVIETERASIKRQISLVSSSQECFTCQMSFFDKEGAFRILERADGVWERAPGIWEGAYGIKERAVKIWERTML